MARALAGRREMRLVALDPGLGNGPCLDGVIMAHGPAGEAGRGGDDPFQLAYTGARRARRSCSAPHRNVLVHALTSQAEGMLGEDCTYLVTGPLFHAAGMWPCTALQVSGGTAILPPFYEPGQAMALIERHRVSETLFVPTMLQMLLDHPDFGRFDLSSLRLATHGGSATTEALLQRAFAALPACQFVRDLRDDGSSRRSAPRCRMPTSAARRAMPTGLGATGRAPQGHGGARGRRRRPGRLPPGSTGEIVCRSEAMMLGYWNRPEEAAEALRNGWMHTGDRGYMDEEGFIFVVDRVKDITVSAGDTHVHRGRKRPRQPSPPWPRPWSSASPASASASACTRSSALARAGRSTPRRCWRTAAA
jgi:long-chain acyl-CoA synthetase